MISELETYLNNALKSAGTHDQYGICEIVNSNGEQYPKTWSGENNIDWDNNGSCSLIVLSGSIDHSQEEDQDFPGAINEIEEVVFTAYVYKKKDCCHEADEIIKLNALIVGNQVLGSSGANSTVIEAVSSNYDRYEVWEQLYGESENQPMKIPFSHMLFAVQYRAEFNYNLQCNTVCDD